MRDVVGCERTVTTRGAPTDTVSRRLGRSAHREDEDDDDGIFNVPIGCATWVGLRCVGKIIIIIIIIII